MLLYCFSATPSGHLIPGQAITELHGPSMGMLEPDTHVKRICQIRKGAEGSWETKDQASEFRARTLVLCVLAQKALPPLLKNSAGL